jgi:hypothetical protein
MRRGVAINPDLVSGFNQEHPDAYSLMPETFTLLDGVIDVGGCMSGMSTGGPPAPA